MSVLFSEYVVLMSEILQIFSSRRLWWKRCVGPGTQTGLTAEELLAILEPQDDLWDDELLSVILRRGLQLGTLKQFPAGYYFANAEMIRENNWNKAFLEVVPTLCEPKLERAGPFVIY